MMKQSPILSMYTFTFISISEPSILYMSFARRINEISLFLNVINGTDRVKNVNSVQEMTYALKDRLSLFDVLGKKAYNVKRYLESIPVGQKFLIISGFIEDQILLHRCESYLFDINNLSNDNPLMDRICNSLEEHYEVKLYSGSERYRIGVEKKENRICRFCGRSLPEVHFKNKSHAISESLGNKGLVCLEECDECNKRFNETIEQDISHMFANNLLLCGVSGKKGVPTIKGDGISIKLDTSSNTTLGRDTIVLSMLDMPNSSDLNEIFNGINKVYELHQHYVPQNVYKCFCKYVLSIVDSSELPYFKDTIKWINEPISMHKLPPVWQYFAPSGSECKKSPSISIFRRKHNAKELPYCWAIIYIAGVFTLFIIPFSIRDKYRFVGKARQDFFINGLKETIFDKVELCPMKLSGINPINMKIRPSFTISPDCIEGRDYYFVDSADMIWHNSTNQ